MADVELRTATELDGTSGFEVTDFQIMPITKAAAGSGLFKVTLATLKAYFLAGVIPVITGQAGKFLAVKGDESGIEWAVPAGGGGGGGSGLPAFAGAGKVLTTNATNDLAVWRTPTGGGGGGGGSADFASVVFTPLGSAGDCTILSQENVASVEQVDHGRYLVTFTTPADDANKILPSGAAWFGPYANTDVMYVGVSRDTDRLSGAGVTAGAVYISTKHSNGSDLDGAQVALRFGYVGASGGGSSGNPSYFAPPAAADFPTLVGYGGVLPTLTDSALGMVMANPGIVGGNDRSQGAYKALPAGVDWSVNAIFYYGGKAADYRYGGLSIRNSATDKTYGFYINHGVGSLTGYFNVGQVANNGQAVNQTLMVTPQRIVYCRIRFENSTGTLFFEFSYDNVYYGIVHQYNIGDYLGGAPDQIGFKMHNSDGSGDTQGNFMTVERWQQSF